jgi:hypothetical protein
MRLGFGALDPGCIFRSHWLRWLAPSGWARHLGSHTFPPVVSANGGTGRYSQKGRKKARQHAESFSAFFSARTDCRYAAAISQNATTVYAMQISIASSLYFRI